MMSGEQAYDVDVGRRLQSLRKASGFTQAGLSEELLRLGLKLSQQTIVKVEAGERPLRLQEAHAITTVLQVEVGALTASSSKLDDFTRATEALVHLRDAESRLIDSLAILASAHKRVVQEHRKLADLSDAPMISNDVRLEMQVRASEDIWTLASSLFNAVVLDSDDEAPARMSIEQREDPPF